MKKLTVLRIKSALWFGAMFVAVAPWYGVFWFLVLTEPFWCGLAFGLVFSVFEFGLAWLLLPNTSEEDCVRMSGKSKEMIRIFTLGLIRFKK